MKKWLYSTCALVLVFCILSGCSILGLEQDRIKVGLSMATRDRFLTAMEAAAVRAAGGTDISLDVANANNDQQAQLAQIAEWAKQGYAAVIVVLCEDESADQVLQKAGSMPVVFVNRKPDDTVLNARANVAYVGSREEDAGRMQGEFLASMLRKARIRRPSIAILAGSEENSASKERIEAARSALAEDGLAVQYIFETDAGWSRETAQKNFTAFLKAKPTVDAVLAANDEMAIGAAEALAQTGYAVADVLITGVDATAEGRAAIRDGRVDFTAYQDAGLQGQGAVELAVRMLSGEGTDEQIRLIGYRPVTQENVDQLFPED